MGHPRYYKGLRERIFLTLGDECVNCGDDDRNSLVVDHLKEERGKKGVPLYLEILRMASPKEMFQILCRTCNWEKR